MPLPFILAAAAIGVAGWGIKKGVDAMSDFDDAERLNEDARDIYEKAQHSLNDRRERTQEELESLGRQKFVFYKDALRPFVDTIQRIKHVDYEDESFRSEGLRDLSVEIQEIREITIHMEDVVGGTAGAFSTGALAGLAAYGSVGLLGTASTGTAIAGLSGAAATNATLAWLGGGSLAAGGFGMAGGAAVLGGIVAAPVLLVGGLIMASKAEDAKNNALSNRRKAQEAATSMQEAEVGAHDIGRMATQVRDVLERLQHYLCRDLEDLKALVSVRTDYRTYDGTERDLVHRTVSLAVTAKNLAETPLLEEEGSITAAIRQALNDSVAGLNRRAEGR